MNSAEEIRRPDICTECFSSVITLMKHEEKIYQQKAKFYEQQYQQRVSESNLLMKQFNQKFDKHKEVSYSHAKEREVSRFEAQSIGFKKSFNIYEANNIHQGRPQSRAQSRIETRSKESALKNKSNESLEFGSNEGLTSIKGVIHDSNEKKIVQSKIQTYRRPKSAGKQRVSIEQPPMRFSNLHRPQQSFNQPSMSTNKSEILNKEFE